MAHMPPSMPEQVLCKENKRRALIEQQRKWMEQRKAEILAQGKPFGERTAQGYDEPDDEELDMLNDFVAGVGEALAHISPPRSKNPPPPDAVKTYQMRSSAPVPLSGEGWVEEDYTFGSASIRLAHMEEAGGLGAMSAARMGLHCWDSASLLCEYMAAPERAATFSRHRSVLELGAGPGMCGLVNHALFGGAPSRTVVLTDGQPGACALLAKNIGLNVADEEVHVFPLRWGDGADACALPLLSYDCILAADCTFAEALNPLLIQSVNELLSPNGGLFLLAVASRTSLLIPQIFALCKAKGLRLVAPILNEHGQPREAPTGGGWILRFER